MTKQNIVDILTMRMAVYLSGVKAGAWTDLELSGATSMMEYIFPKSGQIAYYNLILEQMHKEHDMFPPGAYSLFKLPVQVEKEIMDYLKKESCTISSFVSDCDSYLKSMDTIVTDYAFDAVNIGSFNMSEVDSLLRLCATHYRYSFQNGLKTFPYFE